MEMKGILHFTSNGTFEFLKLLEYNSPLPVDQYSQVSVSARADNKLPMRETIHGQRKNDISSQIEHMKLRSVWASSRVRLADFLETGVALFVMFRPKLSPSGVAKD
jgi:hypothetical protein